VYNFFARPSDRQQTTVGLLGCWGYNSRNRVLPALGRQDGWLWLDGYDLRPPDRPFERLHFNPVAGNADLARQLAERPPDVLLIETPDDTHAELIDLALDAGIRRILCEKCLAASTAEADRLLARVRAARPRQDVRIIDHYPLLNAFQTLLANRERWLGTVTRLDVTLLEEQGVPVHQERSHAAGMANFIHHALALAAFAFDLADLVPVTAAWARHASARVPDTYRAAHYASRRTGEVVLTGAVGKYVRRPCKQVVVEGTHGRAVLDRDRAELRLDRAGVAGADTFRWETDSGYDELARALATGAPLPGLLTVEQAAQALRLVEAAHALARELAAYPEGPEDGVVCDWQMLPMPS
jgi:predicted dehydrogenase